MSLTTHTLQGWEQSQPEMMLEESPRTTTQIRGQWQHIQGLAARFLLP